MREHTYINVSGAAINSNKTAGFFKVNAPQYTSHFKNNRALSILPVYAHFNSNKYKTKKLIPANNTYVSIKGFLELVETDSDGRATSFQVSVDNINFLGKASVSPSVTGNSCSSFYSLSVSVLNSFLQPPLPRPVLPDSNSNSMSPLLAHLLKPPYWTLHRPCLCQKQMYLLMGESGNFFLLLFVLCKKNSSFSFTYTSHGQNTIQNLISFLYFVNFNPLCLLPTRSTDQH